MLAEATVASVLPVTSVQGNDVISFFFFVFFALALFVFILRLFDCLYFPLPMHQALAERLAKLDRATVSLQG